MPHKEHGVPRQQTLLQLQCRHQRQPAWHELRSLLRGLLLLITG
jgi:hypothetical protein